MQHPSREFLDQPMFDSLRRWAHGPFASGDLPLEWTIKAMDEAGVRLGMLCAWWAPRGPLLSNDSVAECVRYAPNRFVGVASVDLFRPMDAVRELRRCVRDLGFKALRIVLGCGICRPMIAATTRCIPSVSSSAFLSVFRSDTQGRFVLLNPAGQALISITSRSNFRSSRLSRVISDIRGRKR